MKSKPDSRFGFLNALIEYGEQSGTSNPHFYRKEMMAKLGISEGEFNILQSHLGGRYCHVVDFHGDDLRYIIFMDECYELRDELREREALDRRHRQMLWATVIASLLASALGAIIGTMLSRHFFGKG